MQELDEFEWDDDNEYHLAKHGVDRYEAEEAATDPAAIVKRVGTDRYGNRRYIYVGKTEDGRILFMVVDRKGSVVGESAAQGTPGSTRSEATESETDEPRNEANKQPQRHTG